MNYPAYVKPYSEMNTSYWGSYMSESDIKKVNFLFPNGLNGDTINIYMVVNGRELIDTIYEKTQASTPERIKIFDDIRKIEEDNYQVLNELREFFHSGGYRIAFDDNLTLVVFKGTNSKKHIEVKLLDKVPSKIMTTWKKVISQVINPMIEAVNKL